MNQPRVSLAADGLQLRPAEYAELLVELTRGRDLKPDRYGTEGPLPEFEERFALRMGKEKAIVMPTGTLAQMLALAGLCRDRGRRVLVQRDSHIFSDTGDGAALIAGLTLVPLQDREAGFSREAVEAEVARGKGYRIATPIGAIAIETPVRRWHGRRVADGDLADVTAYAREAGIGLHLDGARLFIASAFTGRDPRDYAEPFDTVYVSLYKYFNAPFGALVAGPAQLIDDLRQQRMRFGGALMQFWQSALIAGHFLEGHLDGWRRAIAIGEAALSRLSASGLFAIERVPDGTNIFRLTVPGADSESLERFRNEAEAAGLVLPKNEDGGFWARVNQTWLRLEPEDIADRLIAAAKAASSRP
ncbi:MAG: hypothetical protein HYR63_05465 [Proteobacteria bacterium]|nr:hypothetical protein [Pseudomonadota bacterium]MBI3495855.1 hypothetical protein [Pseudomonadota bacterium]